MGERLLCNKIRFEVEELLRSVFVTVLLLLLI